MTGAPPARGATSSSILRALVSGFAVSLLVTAAGQLVGLVLFLAQGANGSYVSYLRLGALYVQLFHHVPVGLRLPSGGGAPPLSVDVGVALLLVPAVGVVLLGAAGRRLDAARSGFVAVGTAAAAAVGYAALPFALAFAARGDVALPADLTVGSALRVDVSLAAAFVTPLVIGAVAIALGALSRASARGSSGDALVADVVVGGVRAFALALALSVAGVLVLAAAEPAFVRVYGAVIGAPDSPKGRAVLAGHAALLVPNQAVWVAVPAMGACDEVTVDGRATPFLCYWRRPMDLGLLAGSDAPIGPANPTFRPPPRGYLAFLLAPLLATAGGGARAARRQRSIRRRALAGAAAGLVFAALMAVGIALARIDVRAGGGFLGDASFRLTLGPELLRGTALAACWGIAGGVLGGVLGSRPGATAVTSDG